VELLERTEMLGAARAVIGDAEEARGRIVVYKGPAGIGKSAVLAAAAAAGDRVRVAPARPTEL
jgi:hypothetical protein